VVFGEEEEGEEGGEEDESEREKEFFHGVVSRL